MENDERLGLPSGSDWARYELCNASFFLKREAIRLGQAAFTTSPAAESGLRKHAFLSGQEVALSETEAEAVEFLRERADDQIARVFDPQKELFTLKEERLWFTLEGRKCASGRIDRIVHDGGHTVLVQDYKGGYSEPDPADINPQLKFYAVLAALNLECDVVVAQIISSNWGVTERRFDTKELARAYGEVLAILKAINDPGATLSPSPKACRYCPAINICPAVRTLVPRVPREASPLPEGPAAASLLEGLEILERRIDAIRSYYIERLRSAPDYSIPGWGLVTGAPRRVVSDWHQARGRLEEFLSAGDLDPVESYQLIAVEKALGKKLKLRGDALRLKLAEILGGLLELKYPEPSLKRVTHANT